MTAEAERAHEMRDALVRIAELASELTGCEGPPSDTPPSTSAEEIEGLDVALRIVGAVALTSLRCIGTSLHADGATT